MKIFRKKIMIKYKIKVKKINNKLTIIIKNKIKKIKNKIQKIKKKIQIIIIKNNIQKIKNKI